MARLSSAIWNYFNKIGDSKKAVCQLCDEIYDYSTTISNLKIHLKKSHPSAYISFTEARSSSPNADSLSELTDDQGNVILYEIEYVQSGSPTLSETHELVTETETRQCSPQRVTVTREKIYPDRRNSTLRQLTSDKGKAKLLIEQLADEKINVTILQKELLRKEADEKNLRIILLKEEMEHKKLVYEVEKEELELRRNAITHKKLMYKLEQEEMLLKIETLKTNLLKIQRQLPDLD